MDPVWFDASTRDFQANLYLLFGEVFLKSLLILATLLVVALTAAGFCYCWRALGQERERLTADRAAANAHNGD